MDKAQKTICFLGGWTKEYSRSVILKRAFISQNAKVVECYVPPSGYNPVLFKELPFFMLSNTVRACRLFYRALSINADVFLVPFPAYYDVPICWVVSKIKRKPLFVDLFISKYVTLIQEFKCDSDTSAKAMLLKMYDKIPLRLATVTLLDTKSHIDLISKKLSVSKKKMFALPVGSMAALTKQIKEKQESKEFEIFFYGSFSPLHGIEYILRAARMLQKYKDIHFTIVGRGPKYEDMHVLAKRLGLTNVEMKGEVVSYPELMSMMGGADICLGIFGDTPKAQAVVPNKVYDALALARPLITAKAYAVEDSGLKDREHVLLCSGADTHSLANAILRLKEDSQLREGIAKRGYAFFQQNFNEEEIGKMLMSRVRKEEK
ncbi:glycosyltransferase [Patescibacteria group bacterium]|nr:glycosyltransferase [Patescibacteria group bacterium]